MARSSPPTNPTVSVFSWGDDDDDEDTVTDYTAAALDSQNLVSEDHSCENSRMESLSSDSNSDSHETSPEATLNPKARRRMSLPIKLLSAGSYKSSVNSLVKIPESDQIASGPKITGIKEGEKFNRNTTATGSIRSNSCPTGSSETARQKRSSTLKPFQSENVIVKGNNPRRYSDVSLASIKSTLDKQISPTKNKSASVSLEIEEELLKPSIPPDHIGHFLTSEYTASQKMRQGDVYEIIQTERNHCIALIEVKKLFKGKDYNAILSEETGILEHLDKIFDAHYHFHENLRELQGDGVYIKHVGNEIHQFLSNLKLLKLDQSYGLVSYYCTRAMKELPSRTPIQITGVPLRLTKLQIQLDSLLKHSVDESDQEKKLIVESLATIKEVLCSINGILDSKEKETLRKTLHRKIDSKSTLFLDGIKFTKKDLDNRQLIHHEYVKITVSQQKVISVELLLFDDVLVFIQKTSSNKYQFYPTHAEKKLIKLHSWIMREKAGTKISFYLFSSTPETAMLEVTTSSGSARALLMKHLSTSIKNANISHQKMIQERRKELHNIAELSYEVFEQKVDECIKDITTASSRSGKNDFKENVHSLAELQLVSLNKAIHEGNQILNECKSYPAVTDAGSNRLEASSRGAIQKHANQLNKFLALSVKLSETNCKSEPQTKLGENYDFDQKIEDLRVQHIMFVEEKKINEERIEEEKKLLQAKAKTLEEEKQRLDKKEKDLVSREQEVLLRRKLMDKYLGACISRSNKIMVNSPLTPDVLFELVQQNESMEKELAALKSEHITISSDGLSQNDCRGTNMNPTQSMPNLSSPPRVQFVEATKNDSSLQDVSCTAHSPLTAGGGGSSMPDILQSDNQGDDFERAFPAATPKSAKKTLTQRLASAVRSTLRGKKTKARSTQNLNESYRPGSSTELDDKQITPKNQQSATIGRRRGKADDVKQTIPKKLAD